MTAWIYGIATCVCVLLVSELRLQKSALVHWKRLKITSKSLASVGFVLLYFFNLGETNLFSNSVLIALILAFIGDLLLLRQESKHFFKLGILTFAAAHLAYIIAFSRLLMDIDPLLISSLISLFLGITVYCWLRRYLTAYFKWLVPVYLLLIGVMMTLGMAAGLSTDNYWLFCGSLGFAISDIFVARNRFINKQIINRLIGLPLYYAAQIWIIFAALELNPG